MSETDELALSWALELVERLSRDSCRHVFQFSTGNHRPACRKCGLSYADLPLPPLYTADALASRDATIAGLREELAECERQYQAKVQEVLGEMRRAEAAEARCVDLMDAMARRATDARYMAEAYRSMLGPNGLKVADVWEKMNVNRVHYSWGPDALAMTGEGRAQVILDFNEAAKTAVEVHSVDSPRALSASSNREDVAGLMNNGGITEDA